MGSMLPCPLPCPVAAAAEATGEDPRDERGLTDGDLIGRVARRDANAFELLYRRYARPVFGLALRRLGDRMRAEDAVQETFAAVWRSARDVQAGARRRRALALRGRAQRDRRPQPRRTRAAGRGARAPSLEPTPAERAETSYVSWRVHRALEGLPAERARRDRARLLRRALAERGRRLPRHPARHGQDADTRRASAGSPTCSKESCDDARAGLRRARRRRRAGRGARAPAARRTSCSSRPGRRRSSRRSWTRAVARRGARRRCSADAAKEQRPSPASARGRNRDRGRRRLRARPGDGRRGVDLDRRARRRAARAERRSQRGALGDARARQAPTRPGTGR